jgi:predicted NBD/HSP70 family sugar kinase
MAEQLRTRRQTRASVLGRLLATGGMFRPRLAAACHLTEASISRIVAELRDEALVEEIRQPAPYPGGPSQLVVLRRDQVVAGLDFAHDRLTVGVGNLAGEVLWSDRVALPAGSAAPTVQAAARDATRALAAWCAREGIAPRRVGASVPGLGAAGANPILALDASALEESLAAAFPGVPVAIGNAVAAHAALQLQADGATAGRNLFLHLGHGVGGAWVDPDALGDPIRPIEIGHVVMDLDGPPCRCGHRGCLEAVASTRAVALLCDVPEADLVAAGPLWPAVADLTPAREAALRGVLLRLGVAIGNALNVMPVPRVAIAGWPAPLREALRDAVREGLSRSLFGAPGAALPLRFLHSATGTDPRPALAFAVHDLVRSGGLPAPARERTGRLAG